MELRHIRYFLAVVDTGSTVRAAQQVHVAQPSLSRQLRALEASLRVSLFERGGSRLSLSAAGHRFLPVARDLVARADSAASLVRSLADGVPPRLTIAAPSATVADVIAPYVVSTGRSGPLVDVVEARGEGPYAALADGVDLAVSASPPPAGTDTLTVGHPPLWVYAPPGHPWHTRRERYVDLAELVAEPLLLPTVDHDTRNILDRAIAAAGCRNPTMLSQSSSPLLAQALGVAGHGVAVVSEDPRYGVEPLLIRGPDGEPLTMTLTAAWKPSHYTADLLASFAKGLATYCANAYPF
ncbi:LysR family transcriptional regulator [Amycolatopsis sp. PS_44_ISF1]|uniref:LysR family transcriptional regulator n=1 Tax=Amycolatopsis sp. PS_44_ISF1 TaxID=2974917 RepID=UPI0028E03AF7|nr:LysR family transcriptional regulator [Amycolatopsis sp. PS_44_ISF1]MDT8912296.1 LysR family transcriptional regulator [Amycolatopsis sp. PS_44_ISF1]